MYLVPDAELARHRLDNRFNALPPASYFTRPHKGWIRAIRDALGMTTGELAVRMGVRQQTISDIERSEQHDTVQLKTLERAAQAMNCRLVYALIPNSSLKETVNAQARRKATKHLQTASQHSRLEDQAVSSQELAAQIEELAAQIANRRGLWTQ